MANQKQPKTITYDDIKLIVNEVGLEYGGGFNATTIYGEFAMDVVKKVKAELIKREKIMTKTTAEKIAVMQAFEEGKVIKGISLNNDGVLRLCKNNEIEPLWDWRNWDYEVEQEKWTPPAGYYGLYCDGEIHEGEPEERYQLFGIEFKTLEDAERAFKEFKFFHWLWHLANEINDGWMPDYSNGEPKFSVIVTYQYNLNAFTPVFKDRETAKKAIEIMKTWDWYFRENHG